MAFTAITSTTFSGGPIAPGGAGSSVVGGGWVDLYGSQWSLDSGGIPRQVLLSGNPWTAAALTRPFAEQAVDSRTRVRITGAAGAAADTIYVITRFNGSGSTSVGYMAGLSHNGSLQLYRYNVNALTQIGTTRTGTALATGIDYWLQFDVVTSGGSTNVTATQFAADGTTVIGTVLTGTDSTAALQGLSGVTGVFYYQATVTPGVGLRQVDTFTGDANAVFLSGPTNGPLGAASSAFTVALNFAPGSAVVVTPSDSAGGGTLTPSSITLSAGTLSGTFTYTAATAGAKSISVTNNASLANNGSPIAYTPTTLIAVNSAAFLFSPGNWKGDTGRGGLAYRQTWNTGATFAARWTASASPTAVLNINPSSAQQNLCYFLNGKMVDQIASSASITLSGITPSATNDLVVFVRDRIANKNSWNNGSNTFRVLGLTVDAASSAGVADAPRPWVLWHGDSITEGDSIGAVSWGAPTAFNFMATYTHALRNALSLAGYDLCVDACGFSGFIVEGNATSGGDVPALYKVTAGVYSQPTSRWDKIDAGVSRLDSNGRLSSYGATGTEPVLIGVNLGTNECLTGLSTTDLRAAVSGQLTAWRAAAPAAILMIVMPFGMRAATIGTAAVSTTTYSAAIANGVADYRALAPNDSRIVLVDWTVAQSNSAQSIPNVNADLVHPTYQGASGHAGRVAQAVLSSLQPPRGVLKGALGL